MRAMCEFMPKAMQTHNTSRCSTAYLNNKIGIVSINDRSAILWILFFFSRYNGHNTSIVHLAWRFVIEIYFWFWEWNVIIITYISMAHFHAMIRSSSAVQRQPLHFWGFFFLCTRRLFVDRPDLVISFVLRQWNSQIVAVMCGTLCFNS